MLVVGPGRAGPLDQRFLTSWHMLLFDRVEQRGPIFSSSPEIFTDPTQGGRGHLSVCKGRSSLSTENLQDAQGLAICRESNAALLLSLSTMPVKLLSWTGLYCAGEHTQCHSVLLLTQLVGQGGRHLSSTILLSPVSCTCQCHQKSRVGVRMLLLYWYTLSPGWLDKFQK